MRWIGEQIWRLSIIDAGWLLLIVGLLLFPTPLPFGIVLVPLGLVMLATEYRWARRLRRRFERRFNAAVRSI